MKKNVLIINYCIIVCLLVFNIIIGVYFYIHNSTSKIFNENILKTVEIKISDNEMDWGYATGCFIDNNGTILTNKHVVYNSETKNNFQIIKVRFANEEEWINATVEKVSEEEDLAIIKINRSNTKFFKFTSKVSNGEEIYTIGNPNGFGLSFTNGVVSSSLKNVVHNNKTIKAIQTSFVINEGNSGGPVFNKKGILIGIISFRLKDSNNDVIQGVSFAIRTNEILEFMNNN